MRTASVILLLLTAFLLPTLATAIPPSTDLDAFPYVPSVPYTYEGPDKGYPFHVAIFRDALPWGDDRVDQILMAHGISFTVFGSADIGVVELEAYDKVILASAQPATFVSAVSTNAYYFNNYAANGGYLLCSMAHMAVDMPTGTNYPGYTQLTLWTTHNAVAIVESGHPVFYDPNYVTNADLSGWNSSTHGELSMSGGTTLLVDDDGSGNVALAERGYGYGYVMATTQTFEYPGSNLAAAENLVLHRYVNADLPLRVAIFRDQYPWNSTDMEDILNTYGIPFTVFGSSDIGVADLSIFDKVFLSNQQPVSFIQAVVANTAYFEDYVNAGGILHNGMSHYSSAMVGGEVYPGGVLFEEFDGAYDVNLDARGSTLFFYPNVIDADDIAFNFASHGNLSAPGGKVMVTSNSLNPGAVLIVQSFGDGMIVSSTLTYPLASHEFNMNLTFYMPRPFPAITEISDVGNDQGRKVRITWTRSGHDFYGSGQYIAGYEIHRWQDQNKDAGWDYIMTVPAHGDTVYQTVVPTLCDSTIADGLCESVFKIKATTGSSFIFFESVQGSGYSVDNLAPSVPAGLLLADDTLSWEESPADDFDYFTVYGSFSPDLTGAVVVGHTTGTDLDVSGSGYHYLLVTATDFSGNESEAAVADAVSGTGETPTAFKLWGAAPNPFNPGTTIKFDLSGEKVVNLRIYDAAGRLVRNLVQAETMPSGSHGVDWDGRDTAGRTVSAGVYIFSLTAGNDEDTGRMLLLK